jgi:predicted HTH transcriptional regulator
MTLGDIGKLSISRNNLLFGLMHRMNLVEKAGTGIMRINRSMKDYGLNRPAIEASQSYFMMSFGRVGEKVG